MLYRNLKTREGEWGVWGSGVGEIPYQSTFTQLWCTRTFKIRCSRSGKSSVYIWWSVVQRLVYIMPVRRLLVGLGNNGAQFKSTRHNVGFRVIDYFEHMYLLQEHSKVTGKNLLLGEAGWISKHPSLRAAEFASSPDLLDRNSKRRKERTAQEGYAFPSVDLTMLKPRGFMNGSGHEVARVIRSEKWRLRRNPNSYNLMDEMLVVYDDLDTPFGSFRFKPKGGAGGHNGLRDIIRRLGHDRFPRLRIGIGRDNDTNSPIIRSSKFVLSPFDGEEKKRFNRVLFLSAEILRVYLFRGFAAAAAVANSTHIAHENMV